MLTSSVHRVRTLAWGMEKADSGYRDLATFIHRHPADSVGCLCPPAVDVGGTSAVSCCNRRLQHGELADISGFVPEDNS